MSSTDYKTYINESLEFLDNNTIRYGLYTFMVVYILFIIPLLTPDVSHLFNNTWLQLFFLILIIYISLKDIYLGILILIGLLMSLHMDLKNMVVFTIPKPKERPFDVPTKIILPEKQPESTTVEITNVPPLEQFEPMGYNDNSYRDTADLNMIGNFQFGL